jgi:hypothetical protein
MWIFSEFSTGNGFALVNRFCKVTAGTSGDRDTRSLAPIAPINRSAHRARR